MEAVQIVRAIQRSDVRITVGNQKLVRFSFNHDRIVRFVVMHRVGKGERWEMSFGDIYRREELPSWLPREARVWAERSERFDVRAHAVAMGRRTL